MKPHPGRRAPLRLLHAFSSFELGGIQSRFVQLARTLGDRFEHVVVAMDGNFAAAEAIADLPNVALRRVPARGGRLLADVPLLARELARIAPDRLVTYNWGAFEWTLANVLRRVPQLHVEEGFNADETARRLARRSMTRAVGLRAAGAQLVVVSQTMARIARREWHVPPARLTIVPNGVDTARYEAAGERGEASRLARAPGELVVGTVAGLRPVKRIDRLIDAFAEVCAQRHGAVPPLRLAIVGDGACRADLQAQAHALGLADRVDFLGFQPDPRPLYAQFDLLALSSDSEQMPLAVLEAMAAALPVASTDVGDVAAMVSEANRPFVVEPDATALADAIARLARADRRRIGLDNRAVARARFTRERMVDAWEQLYAGAAPPAVAGNGSIP